MHIRDGSADESHLLYLLEGREVVPVHDALMWAQILQSRNQCIAFSRVNGVAVSTIFLGVNKQFRRDLPPAVFETMILGGWFHLHGWYTSTYDEAESTHAGAVVWVERFRWVPGMFQVAVTWWLWRTAAQFYTWTKVLRERLGG